MRRMRLLTVGASVIVLAVIAAGQLTVDATGPTRQRKREATHGQGGGVGRKLPLTVAIETRGSSPDEKGRSLVEFILTNSSKNGLTLPISPHPGDLEPPDPRASYTLLTLGLRVSLSKKPGVIFPGGAELYGSAELPQTLVSLAPGGSIRVLTRVALPEGPSAPPDSAEIVASASLDNETMSTINGQMLLDSQEIGFARSPEYTVESLSKSPE